MKVVDALVSFNEHSKCVRCHDKGLDSDPCVLKRQTVNFVMF